MRRLPLCLVLFTAPALAAPNASESVVAKLKSSGYLCKDTSDGLGYSCTGESPAVFITVPKGIEKFERSVYYAHGIPNVCSNAGVSGENHLRGYAGTLRNMKAIAVMPIQRNAQDASFPMTKFIRRMDGLLGSKDLPWDLVGHSGGGPFLSRELNDQGAAILGRVQNLLLLDAVYGDQSGRWTSVLKSQPNLKMTFVATTATKGTPRTRDLANSLKSRFGNRVSLNVSSERHCNLPGKYFSLLNNGRAPAVQDRAEAIKGCRSCLLNK